MNQVSVLFIEDRISCPLLDMRLLTMLPGLVGEEIQADIRVCAVLTAGQQVPVWERPRYLGELFLYILIKAF